MQSNIDYSAKVDAIEREQERLNRKDWWGHLTIQIHVHVFNRFPFIKIKIGGY